METVTDATPKRVHALLADPIPIALLLGALALAAVIAVVALQRYSSSRYQASVQTYDLGFKAQGLNALAWGSLSAIDPVHFPDDSQRPPADTVTALDAALLDVQERLDGAPRPARESVDGYVQATARIADLIHERSTDEAFVLLNETTAGPTSPLARVAVDTNRLGEEYAAAADRVSTLTTLASIAIMLLALGAGGVIYRGFRSGRRAIEGAEAEREVLRRSEARFRPLVHYSTDVIAVVDRDAHFQYVSPAMERNLGLDPADLSGRTLFGLVHPDDSSSLESLFAEVLVRANYTATAEVRLLGEHGGQHRFEIVCSNLLSDPDVAGLVLNMRDVTERKEMEEQLRRLAFHDPLTNLANRLRFIDRLEHALLRVRRAGERKVSVLYLDLDHFKAVNDELGHSAGDAVLKEVAARILRCIRPADTAARLGGDEFAVLLEDTGSPAEAQEVAERLLSELGAPFTIETRELALSASIGIVVADPTTATAEEVIRDADIAMYDAKESGRGRAHLFEHGMHVSLMEHARLIKELNGGVDGDEFVIFYQPVVDLLTEEPLGFEALVRWRHPRRGLLVPAEFIGLAEETGAIVGLGETILSRACEQLRAWQLAYPNSTGLTMSVNVSAKQIQRPDFVEAVERALAQSGLDPSLLILEITESVLVSQPQRAIDTLSHLKALGVHLALDDFGTGYSSLSYLKRFPIDVLKIDRSFVEGVDGTGKDRTLVQTVVELARTLDLDIVAEGIERRDQLAWLRTLECGTGQGYLFARPLEPAAAERLVAKADLRERRPARKAAAAEQRSTPAA